MRLLRRSLPPRNDKTGGYAKLSLRIVYEEKEEVNEIVTIYLTSQIDRYWRG